MCAEFFSKRGLIGLDYKQLTKIVVRLSMVTYTDIDSFRNMSIFDLCEIVDEVLEVQKQIGKGQF